MIKRKNKSILVLRRVMYCPKCGGRRDHEKVGGGWRCEICRHVMLIPAADSARTA